MKPLIVMPTYNERDNLGQLIPAILDADERLHIIVIDDDSPDGTAGAVMALKEGPCGPRLFLHSRPGKFGVGSAYIHGYVWGLAEGYDFFIEMDGDWSHRPQYLAEMLRLGESADFVIGSRYVAGGGTLNWGPGRRLLSRFGNFYARSILNVNIADFTGGFNGWTAATLQKIGLDTIRSNGYSFQIEMKYRAHRLGCSHVEFPIVFDERRAGQSKMSTTIGLEACWRVWQFRFRGGGVP